MIEDLQIVEQRIHDIDVSSGIHGSAFGPAEMAGAITNVAELTFEISVSVQNLHSGIHRIRHEQVAPAVYSQMCRKIEFATADAAPSEFTLKVTPETEYHNHVSLRISNEQAIIENYDAGWSPEVIGYLKQEFAVLSECNNPRQH